jgi:3-deoxy-D-manno-octulosonic-acid transferase
LYTLYSLLLTLGVLATSPYWLFKALRERKYFGNILQRLGSGLPQLEPGVAPVWIHAVSVGEVLAAKAFFLALRRARPDLPIVISTVTLTGQALARTELGAATAHLYFPFDWQWCIARFLRCIRPRAVVLMETELWPNFIRGCACRNIPIFLANGRISDRSRRRYAWARPLFADMLSRMSAIGVQTAEDKHRFVSLGAAAERIRITGNVKYDFSMPASAVDESLLRRIMDCLGRSHATLPIVVGSSMKGEEIIYLKAFERARQKNPQARLILAPRHPERFDEVARLLASRGTPFLRRSALDTGGTGEVEVLLLDSIGELRTVYNLAAVAVIGGSFLPYGGHNLLEPALLGKAIVFGPYMFNFKEAARLFLEAQSARQCDSDELPEVLAGLLADGEARNLLGARAQQTLRQNQGATEATLDLIAPYLEG